MHSIHIQFPCSDSNSIFSSPPSRGFINPPMQLAAFGLYYLGGVEVIIFFAVQHFLERVSFISAEGEEGDLTGAVDDGRGKGDAIHFLRFEVERFYPGVFS